MDSVDGGGVGGFQLFGKRKGRAPKSTKSADHGPASDSKSPTPGGDATARGEGPRLEDTKPEVGEEIDDELEGDDVAKTSGLRRWKGLGLSQWLCEACLAMGLKRPTAVQRGVIPSLLSGKDVIACSQTGTGKTAAFALPILHKLSEDPYGIFAVVLTPGRELAHQIGEQFSSLGAPMGVRVAVVTGGMDLTRQSAELARLPHVVVATPGRLAALIAGGSTCPRLAAVACVVLDEADRLLEPSMAPDMSTILEALPAPDSGRQTVLISATITKSLAMAERMALKAPMKWSATAAPTTASNLAQEYILSPKAVKTCHLVHVIDKVGPGRLAEDPTDRTGFGSISNSGSAAGVASESRSKAVDADDVAGEDGADSHRASAAIVFVSTLYTCQLVTELLTEMGVVCVGLHSAMNQRRRIAALAKFKSQLVPVLVATDVASRGLDIPKVELVINYDVPRLPSDYIHRVGRTARAGRGGRAISLVTENDVSLIHGIEAKTGVKMSAMAEFDEEEALKLLKKVATAVRVASLRLTETGFEEALKEVKKRKKKSKKRQAEWTEAEAASGEGVERSELGELGHGDGEGGTGLADHGLATVSQGRDASGGLRPQAGKAGSASGASKASRSRKDGQNEGVAGGSRSKTPSRHHKRRRS